MAHPTFHIPQDLIKSLHARQHLRGNAGCYFSEIERFTLLQYIPSGRLQIGHGLRKADLAAVLLMSQPALREQLAP